jgi:hypothetical protein
LSRPRLPGTNEAKMRDICEKNETFWKEVKAYSEMQHVPFDKCEFAIRVLCGETPWCAYQKVGLEPRYDTVIQMRAAAVELLQKPAMIDVTAFAKELSKATFNIQYSTWGWNFQDSENSLRFLHDCATENLIENNGQVTNNVIQAILGSVRELNKMHGFDGSSIALEKARTVIFFGEDAIPD